MVEAKLGESFGRKKQGRGAIGRVNGGERNARFGLISVGVSVGVGSIWVCLTISVSVSFGGCFQSDVKRFGLVGLVISARSRFKVKRVFKACVQEVVVLVWGIDVQSQVVAAGLYQPPKVRPVSANACATISCLLYTSPSPRDQRGSRMPSSA